MAKAPNPHKCADRALEALASGMPDGPELQGIILAACVEQFGIYKKVTSKVGGHSVCVDLSCPLFPIVDTNTKSWLARVKKRDEALKEREKKFSAGKGKKSASK